MNILPVRTTSLINQPLLSLKPKKLVSPRLLINEKLPVRQYIVSVPSICITLTFIYSSPKTTSTAKWQQQMKNTSFHMYNLYHQSDRLQHKISSTRPLHLIDDFNPYYLDPNYGFDPYWDVNFYNQHDSFLQKTFDK